RRIRRSRRSRSPGAAGGWAVGGRFDAAVVGSDIFGSGSGCRDSALLAFAASRPCEPLAHLARWAAGELDEEPPDRRDHGGEKEVPEKPPGRVAAHEPADSAAQQVKYDDDGHAGTPSDDSPNHS